MEYVVAHRRDLNGLERYLYRGQEILPGRAETMFGEAAVIACERLTEDLVDRLRSGLFGARSFESLGEALKYVEELT